MSTSRSSSYLALLALAVAAFGIGTTEFVIMGLLPEVAGDLGVTPQAAGRLVSGYALGVAGGAPVLAILTARWPRRRSLLSLIALFIVGNALCALAPGYGALMGARVVTAFCHAAFFGIGAVVAADLVEPRKRAFAVGLMFTGLTVANVLGVPLGTALGQWTGWRSTFWAVTVIGGMALLALQVWLPRHLPRPVPGNLWREFRSLVAPQVQLALLISTLASVGMFTVFTYIAYILREVTGFSASQESMVLLLFGAGITVGGLAGGKLADWKLMPGMAGLFAAVALIMVAFAYTSHYMVPTLVTLFVWGAVSFAVVPAAQVRVLDQAREASNIASTLNQGAFNLGNATGAWLGGLVIGAGLPLTNLPWVGASVAFVGFAVVLAAMMLERGTATPIACDTV
ncbi:MFS transporter [Dyella sp.]|uniref:MFS transporter n=1 Tax=Dyella sp. TaxID=1869338 RepID=UPI002ED66718